MYCKFSNVVLCSDTYIVGDILLIINRETSFLHPDHHVRANRIVCLRIYSTKSILKYVYQLHNILLTIKHSVVINYKVVQI